MSLAGIPYTCITSWEMEDLAGHIVPAGLQLTVTSVDPANTDVITGVYAFTLDEEVAIPAGEQYGDGIATAVYNRHLETDISGSVEVANKPSFVRAAYVVGTATKGEDSDLNDAMQPWLTPELIAYNNAMGAMFRQVEELSDWEVVFDVDKCPDYALPYLAQFVGVRIVQGSGVASKRQQIRRPTRQDRGTVYAIREAIMPLLTGGKSIVIRERDGTGHDDNAWWLTVITLDDETADPAAVEAAIRLVKPAGIVLHYNSVLGQDWDSVDQRYATWADVKADNHDWGEVKTRDPV